MDFDSTEMLMFFAEQGLPAYGTLAPIGGISAPLRLSGMLVQMNAEWHAAAVLAQMSRSGTPLIYNHLPVVGDMRSGAYAAGAVETGIVAAALAQLGRHYGYPTGSYLSLTNAKLADAQAGVEKTMSPTLAAPPASTSWSSAACSTPCSPSISASSLLDDEMALMIKRFRQDLRFRARRRGQGDRRPAPAECSPIIGRRCN
jgi:trimethylamine--corrinoid protein Co-methyltransferase